MMRETLRLWLLGDWVMVKMERRRRASVVLPELEGPERAMRWVLNLLKVEVISGIVTRLVLDSQDEAMPFEV